MPLDALVHAVLVDPDADEPRLRYARELDTLGDPRGEFIRLQIEAAHQPLRFGGSPNYWPLKKAAELLLDRHRERWLGPIGDRVTNASFIRGFVENVRLDAASFLVDAAELYALAPIRMIALTDARPVIGRLSQTPDLARLVKVMLQHAELTDADVKEFVASPHLTKLKVLDLAWNEIGEVGLEAVCAASSRLPSLVYVNLSGNRDKDPTDNYSHDASTLRLVEESVQPTELGTRLEATYGPQPWPHAPSRLENMPPDDDEL